MPSTDSINGGPAAGPHERQCTAHARSGNRCKRYAAAGTTVCRMHGGAAPQVQAAAKRRLLAEQLRAIADVELDEGFEADPAEAVLGALRAAHERLRLLRVIYGDELLVGTPAAVRLEGEALDRVGKLGRLAIDLGVRERANQVRDRLGGAIAAAHGASVARMAKRKGITLDAADLAQLAADFSAELAPLERAGGHDGE
jgi:hypothetical protein